MLDMREACKIRQTISKKGGGGEKKQKKTKTN